MVESCRRLPIDEVKLLRAFARAELLDWRQRYGGAARWRVLVFGVPAAVAGLWRMLKRGEALGLPARVVRRAVRAEIDSLEAEEAAP